MGVVHWQSYRLLCGSIVLWLWLRRRWRPPVLCR